MKRYIPLFFLCCFLIFNVSAQDAPAWEILSLINADRQVRGVPALAMNTELVAAAQRHSNDLATNDFLSHVGSDGSEFWQRITDSGYPMTSGAENVLFRWDASGAGAFQQWKESAPHYDNMMNNAYQEMGAAYSVAASGKYYFTLVLASRSNFVPPTATPLQLPSATPEPIVAVSSTPQPTVIFQPTENIPVATNPPTITPIVAILTPSITPILPTAPMPSTATPIPFISYLQPNEVYQRLFRFPQPLPPLLMTHLPPTPTMLPTPTIMPTWTPIPITPTTIPIYDIRLIYDWNSFLLKNTSGRPLFIEGLSFVSASGEFNGERWNNGYLTASLGSFPADDCLQVWDLNTNFIDVPSVCDNRHAWATVNDQGTFWRDVEYFDVYRYGERVTTCMVSQGYCDFYLTDRLPVPSYAQPTATFAPSNNSGNSGNQSGAGNQSTGLYDITLLYSSESFSIINTSGANLDLTGLGFASSNGIMNIGEWDTEYLSRPLWDFPSGDCLQAWSVYLDGQPSKPAQCNWRHGYLTVGDTRQFWLNADVFTASRNGTVLATCNISAGVCTFDLP